MHAMTLWLPRLMARFAGDRRGVSAVEFALLAPVMIALYLGLVEISDGIGIDRKVSLTAATLANLTAQATTITTSEMSNILDASSAIVAPYSASKLKMTVSCLNIDSDKNVTVKWSVYAQRHGAQRRGVDPDRPAGGGYAADPGDGLLRLYAGRSATPSPAR